MMTLDTSLLATHLEAFVPIEMKELQKQGGATDWHIEEAQRRLSTFREPGASEALYFVSKDQTRCTMATLVECLAVLAFVPGGVTAFGCHFEAGEKYAATSSH